MISNTDTSDVAIMFTDIDTSFLSKIFKVPAAKGSKKIEDKEQE